MTVTVYSTQTCPYCTMAKRYLESKNISFTDKDVSKDRAAAAEMISKSGQRGVPVLDFEGTIVIGFDRDKIDRCVNP